MKAIYKILNNENGKFYIGSAQNLRARWNTHRRRLERGEHENSYLQRAWNKHGKENFTFLVLEEIEQDEQLVPAEQKWLNETRSYDREVGYNICPTAGSPLGVKRSKETRKKISKALRGRAMGHRKETRRKISEALKGRPKSEEHIRKMSEANRGDKSPTAKLTWEKVREMRAIYERGEMGPTALGRLFGVDRKTAESVVKGRSWKNDPVEQQKKTLDSPEVQRYNNE